MEPKNANYIGYATASGQQNAMNPCSVPTPKQSVSNEILSRLENLNCILSDVQSEQSHLLDRLHGPRPEKSGEVGCATDPNGILSVIDQRLNWLLSKAQSIRDNQQKLNNLA